MAKAGGQLAEQAGPVKTGLMPALKEAAFAGLITFGLCIPIIAYGTRQDLNNRLIIEARWDAVAWAVAIVFIGRLLVTLNAQRRALGGAKLFRVPKAAQPALAKLAPVLAPIAIGFLFAFPVIAILLSGWAGSTKWIDNFGVQILIYVMLGWGLNIVVGLAGLLDLGYVAFYAVGAYSYALFATKVIPATYPGLGLWAFWICLPVAGILAAFWGILLGFPVLRLRGDYLAIVTLAFGEMIRLVLINWVDFSGGYAGISGIPRPSFFGIPFNANDNGFAATFGLEFTPIYRTCLLYTSDAADE